MNEIVVRGGPELLRAMERLEKVGNARPQVEAALKDAAGPIEAEAERRAPVRTGKLRKSITTKVVKKSEAPRPTVRIFPKAFWGLFQEYGYGEHLPRERPFMRPAFDHKWAEAITIFGTQMFRNIERMFLKRP